MSYSDILLTIIIYYTNVSICGIIMHEKECWTTLGRKKVYLVDDHNQIIREIRDLGPLSELEMKWVRSNCGMPYKEWLKTLEEEEEEGEGEDGQLPDSVKAE